MLAGKPLYAAMKTDFDLAPVIDTAVAHDGITRADAAERLDALLQWLSVLPFARPGEPIQMLESVDRLWHAFMLHTRLYRRFCDRFFGRYIDHDPLDRDDDGMSKKAYARFTLTLLRQQFGDSVHPLLADLTKQVTCCYGQCDDDGGGSAMQVVWPDGVWEVTRV